MTEKSEKNLIVLKDYFEAMKSGGPAAAAPFYASDVELIVPGTHSAAGTYRGAEGIGQFGAAMAQLTGGTFRLSPIELFSSDDRVVTFASASAKVDGKDVEWKRVIVTDMRDGKFARLQFFEDNQSDVNKKLGAPE